MATTQKYQVAAPAIYTPDQHLRGEVVELSEGQAKLYLASGAIVKPKSAAQVAAERKAADEAAEAEAKAAEKK